MSVALIRTRLGQYGAVWLGAFLLSLFIALVGVFAVHADLIRLADLLLPIAFCGLALIVAIFVAVTLFGRASAPTKVALIVLGGLLVLPLLWAPVLSVVLAADLAQAPIEYSNAYAEFRIDVSDIVYPAFHLIFASGLAQTAWSAFQGVATVIGVTSASLQLWPYATRLLSN